MAGRAQIHQPGEAHLAARALKRKAWAVLIIWTLAAWTAGFFMGHIQGEKTWHEVSTTS